MREMPEVHAITTTARYRIRVYWVRVLPSRMSIELERLIADVASALISIDRCGAPFKEFKSGVGPYGEPQLLAAVARFLNTIPEYNASVKTKRTPDLLIPDQWALEFKIARPFGDNGKEAENWSVNLLHPYEGNVSLIGDCLKLQRLEGPERKAVVVVGFEHTPPRISLSPLFYAFELVATKVAGVKIGPRVEMMEAKLCHPVHQQLLIAAWEVSAGTSERV